MERDFKGVWIPKEIWLNKELSMLEKVLYTEISSLDNENHCTAGNEYFAEFCNCSQSAITKAIKRLKELNLIEEIEFDGRHRKIGVVKNTNLPSKIYEAESQNLLPNNIYSNINNKKSIFINKNTIEKSRLVKKQSLYDKASVLIKQFTDDPELQESLFRFLDLQLEIYKESHKTYYINIWKSKLAKLKEFSEDERLEIVKNATEKGWQNFYPLKSYDRNSVQLESKRATKEQLEHNYKMALQREKEGKRGFF